MVLFYFVRILASVETAGKQRRPSMTFNAVPLILEAGGIKNLLKGSSYLSSCKS